MEESPNSLKPQTPVRRGLSKKPLFIFLGLVVMMLCLLFYAIQRADRHSVAKDDGKKAHVETMPLAQSQGKGLTLPAPPSSAAVVSAPEKKEPLVIVQKSGASDDEKKEAETIRKKKEAAYLAGLSSPLLARRVSNQPATTVQPESQKVQKRTADNGMAGLASEALSKLGLGGASQNGDAYDPAASKDKENFFQRADTGHGDKSWLSPYTREAGRQYEVKTGTVIPAVMVTGINSELPGQMIAQISQNVYDTATGRYLLFPQGAKLYGVYDSRVIYGQSRVLTAWNRVVFPDGTSVTLGAMNGADMSGYAGFTDQVNNHYWRIFGSAFLMAAITGGTSYAVDNVGNNNNDSTKTTFQDAMASALATQWGQASARLLEKNINISPTLEIRPGYQFNIIVTKDIAFKGPYRSTTGEHYGAVPVRP